jgi:hypothetical protein
MCEADALCGFAKARAGRLRARTKPVMRFGLNAVTLDFRVNRRKVDPLFANGRRTRLGFGRFVGGLRLPTFRFECLAKIARLGMDWDVR